MIDLRTDLPPHSAALTTDDFDYYLPTQLIAAHPPAERSASRLLRLSDASTSNAITDAMSDQRFTDLPQFLERGDVLVFNDTRVIKGRLFGEKDSGGRVEVLIERVVSAHVAWTQVRASKAPRPGTKLRLEGAISATMVSRQDDLFELHFDGEESLLELLERHGRLPLPPYIERPADNEDEARYQTVYAQAPGAVAAPTAGLHFDEAMLERLREAGIVTAWLTLHVGAGTFQPVRTNLLSEHRMHAERFSIPAATAEAIATARTAGRRIVAVGTTSLRALEAAASEEGVITPGEGETRIFITPGYRFRVVDRLLTNFHLPRSTLLMLVSAFAGMAPVRAAYRHAIEEGYRFFSYGDAMLIDRMPPRQATRQTERKS